MSENRIEIKKIENKIELDTTQEGFWDCGKCYHHQVISKYVESGLGTACVRFWTDKQNTWFVPA